VPSPVTRTLKLCSGKRATIALWPPRFFQNAAGIPLHRALENQKKPWSASAGCCADPLAVVLAASRSQTWLWPLVQLALLICRCRLLPRPVASTLIPKVRMDHNHCPAPRQGRSCPPSRIFSGGTAHTRSATPSKERGGGRELNPDRAMVLLQNAPGRFVPKQQCAVYAQLYT
jgi:hypothetical protein